MGKGECMASKRYDGDDRLRAVQLGTALYSVVFIYFVARGYVHLFEKEMPVFAYAAGLVFALIAWNLAKIIGGEEGGIRKHKPLFALLLLISALGIFNALFAILETKPILEETVKDSREKFVSLRSSAEKVQDQLGITARLNAIDEARDQLNTEIKNPMKCGQGPKAMEAIQKLASLLPGFVPLAGGAGAGCSKADEVVAAYTGKIDQLKKTAKWNSADLQSVVAGANAALAKLDEAKLKAEEGSLTEVRHIIGEVEPIYSEAATKLQRYQDGDKLPADLNLVQIKSIGEWSQIINLVIGRIGYTSTYLYFSIAVFADWMMIYFFSLLRVQGSSARTRPSRARSELGKPW